MKVTVYCTHCGERTADVDGDIELGESPASKASGSTGNACSTASVSERVINRWFDYWMLQANKSEGTLSGPRRETIERIRQCALAGINKPNNADREKNYEQTKRR